MIATSIIATRHDGRLVVQCDAGHEWTVSQHEYITDACPCPGCECEEMTIETSGRERGDDDGQEYGDPRDEMDERMSRW